MYALPMATSSFEKKQRFKLASDGDFDTREGEEGRDELTPKTKPRLEPLNQKT